MAYRRRQSLSRSSTFKEEFHDQPSPISSSPPPPPADNINNNNKKKKDSDEKTSSSFFSSFSTPPSLAAQAIKASRRNPSLSFAFNPPSSDHQRSKSFDAYGDAGSGRGDSKSGFWGVLAQKAKSIIDDDNAPKKHDDAKPKTLKSRSFNTFTGASAPQSKPSYQYPESNYNGKVDNPKFRKGLDKITSSLNQLGDTFEKAFEEGKTIVESKTADLRTQMRRKGSNGPEDFNLSPDLKNPWQQLGQTTQNPTNHETQLKASRDVAMATAAKAKLLLRELKTVKADLAFAKARCAQLEEENKMLRDREGTDKGQNRDDDDLIRHQLETLLAEKARLASENEIYARENRFLREIVEYHQLTMQDVVYLDEGMEEVTEVYPIDHGNGVPMMLSLSQHSPSSPPSPDEAMITKDMFPVPEEEDSKSASEDEAPPSVSVSQHAK